MKIVTKYDMNELVYFKYEGKIYCSMVYGIDISFWEHKKTIRYDVIADDKLLSICEKKIFPTKEELLKSL